MPLPAYGVLIGTLGRFAREDPNNFGSWYHGKLYVDTPDGRFECAVDVSSPSGVRVQYRVADSLDERLFAPITSLAEGWHILASDATSGALDYVRSPLLRRSPGCLAVLLAAVGWRSDRWIDSTGDNALDKLEAVLVGAVRVFVFGAPYISGLGVHDIHMNQGDPPGQFRHLDGIWQDGGVVIRKPDRVLVAFLTKFETQSLETDDQGLPIP